jgi:hypothetical protein
MLSNEIQFSAPVSSKLSKFQVQAQPQQSRKTSQKPAAPTTGKQISGKEMPDIKLNEFLVVNVYDLADIYTHICFNVFPTELNNKEFISMLERISHLTIRSNVIAAELCNVLESKSLNKFDSFIEKYSNTTEFVRSESIFRYDPKAILNVFMTHKNQDAASCFMRYVLHTKYLPDMEAFLEQYKNADSALRDALVPKIIYSWHNIE